MALYATNKCNNWVTAGELGIPRHSQKMCCPRANRKQLRRDAPFSGRMMTGGGSFCQAPVEPLMQGDSLQCSLYRVFVEAWTSQKNTAFLTIRKLTIILPMWIRAKSACTEECVVVLPGHVAGIARNVLVVTIELHRLILMGRASTWCAMM